MGRIECETAAQCQDIARAMEATIEPAITIMVVAAVAIAVGLTVYQMKTSNKEGQGEEA